MTEDFQAKGADRAHWIGQLRVSRYGWRLWGFERWGRGVGPSRRPWRAYRVLKQWERNEERRHG